MVEKTEKNYIAVAPLRRLMKEEGAKLVSQDAVYFLLNAVTSEAKRIVKGAGNLVRDDRRKRVQAQDIKDFLNSPLNK